jgi:site-specific DNA recombinase
MKTMAALYARVSTQHQEQEATIASQVAALEAYAETRHYQLSKELYFLDEAVSGARLDRPGLDRLRDLAGEGVFDAVLCLSPDRLSRQYAHQWILLEELRKKGVEMVFVDQPPVESNPQSQLFFGIQGLFAEYERAMITERLRRGRLYHARQGEFIGPSAAYGYRYIPVQEIQGGRWEIDEPEAVGVRQIYAWYTQEGMTIGEITARLEAQKALYPPRNGKFWSRGTVHNILTQADYTGQAYYNRTRNHSEEIGQPKILGRGKRQWGVRILRPQNEWIAIPIPEIISMPIWQSAQERLVMNRKFAGRNNQKHFYLLRTLLVCQTCGRTLLGRTSRKGTITYACTYRPERAAPDIPRHTCTIAGEMIEPLVWQTVCDLLRNPQLISHAWEGDHSAVTDVLQNRVGQIENRIKTLEQQQERLLDLFQDGQIGKDIFIQRKERIAQECQALQQQFQQLRNQEQTTQLRRAIVMNFTDYCQQIEAGLADPSPELQQEVIRLLIDHIVVGDQEIIVKHIVPILDNCCLSLQRKN